MKPVILFFGDSYANCGKSSFIDCNQTARPTYPVYEDIVADALDMDQIIHGYGGASWWFSRCKMIDYFKNNMDMLGRVEVVVAMHTNSSRINTMLIDYPDDQMSSQYYGSEVYDQRFHDWAQKQWFREFSNIFRNKKVINFFCYPLVNERCTELPHVSDLCGMHVQNPLIHVTLSEFCGTQKEIDYCLANSHDMPGSHNPHHNHMNAHNHRALANQLVGLITEWQPQTVTLDFSQFDVVNPNFSNWPDGKYWTRD